MKYIDTTGYSSLAIAICDRCKRKKPYVSLSPDRNSPGLRVCDECNDVFDPWRLPAPPVENISLTYPRPDTPIEIEQEVGPDPPPPSGGYFVLNQSLLDGPDILA